MMKKNIALCFGFFLMFMQQSFAGNAIHAFTVTIADAYYRFDDKRDLSNSSLPNLSLAYNASQHWAIEASAGILNTKQDSSPGDSVDGALYSLNGIYRFTPHGHFEPYLIGGIGMLVLTPNGVDSNHPGNINAGLGAQLFWGSKVALRAEVRDFYQTTGSERNDYMVNLGVSFLFGG